MIGYMLRMMRLLRGIGREAPQMIRLYVDDATDAGGGHDLFNPSLDEIKSFFLELNGDTHTLVTFGDEAEDWHMTIGRGPDKVIAYISYLDDEDIEHIIELTNPADSENEEVELVVAGQRCRYPLSSVIKLDDALVAAKIYYDRHVPDDSLTWTES